MRPACGETHIVGLQEKGCKFWLGVGPLRGGDGAGAIPVTATGILDYGLIRFRTRRLVAVVNALAEAAGMRRRSCNRERYGRNTSQKREQQQQSGSQAVHGFLCESEPQVRLA